jgi:hypothetical protein
MSVLPVLSLCGASAAEALVRPRLERFPELRLNSMASDDVPVSETWEEGLDGAGVVVLLHPDAMPPQPSRQYWGSLIDYAGPRPIAYVQCGARAYPPVFERRSFFRWPADARALERWAVALGPRTQLSTVAPAQAEVPEELWSVLVDGMGAYWITGKPATGKSRMAQAFAYAARGHFQSTLWIGCGRRSAESIQAELERRLPAGRTLLVLDDLRVPLDLPGAPHSVLVTGPELLGEGEWLDLEDPFQPPSLEPSRLREAMSVCLAPDFPLSLAREIAGEPQALPGEAAELLDAARDRYRLVQPQPPSPEMPGRHFDAVLRRFRHWRARPAACAEVDGELEAALDFGFVSAWEESVDLCRAAFDCYSEGGRLQEAVAVMRRLEAEAEGRGDRATMDFASGRLAWVVDGDGELKAPVSEGDQLSLF